jgi:hypothetical protein
MLPYEFFTGFRAPALHQIYLSNIQTLVSGGKISNQGTFNNVDLLLDWEFRDYAENHKTLQQELHLDQG